MSAPPAPTVDVIVPVYGAAAALGRCLASLARPGAWDAGEGVTARLHLVLDGPQGQDVEAALAGASTPPATRVTRLPRRRGFPGAANAGLAQASGDAVLLNSDTRVTAGWLRTLRAAAWSAPRVASATPWTNSSTITSLPRWLAANDLPLGWDEHRLAALVERSSARRYPALPTGVGVCLYLRREALDAVGLLDEKVFDRGYGEEVDWCRRALARGFTHVLADATFLFHEGQASFGRDSPRLLRRAARLLRRRDPRFERDLAAFLAADPLAAVRRPILDALLAESATFEGAATAPPPPATPLPRRAGAPTHPPGSGQAPPGVVHLVHGWPPETTGGTELYAWWLAREQARQDLAGSTPARRRRRLAVYTRRAAPDRPDGEAWERLDGAIRVRQVVNNFAARDPLRRNAIWNRALAADWARFLDEERPDLVHVHHLAGHAANLVAVAARRGVPVLYQIQDWWTGCARANLLDRWGAACPGPGLARCARCAPLTGIPPRGVTNRGLHAARRAVLRRALGSAQHAIAGSATLARSFERLGWLPAGTTLEVVPYAPDESSLATLRDTPVRRDGPLRCGFVGTLMPHKGARVAVEAFLALDPDTATLEVWGNPRAQEDYARALRSLAAGAPQVTFHGDFTDAEKPAVYGRFDVLVVPSLGLESFGLAAHEALAAGRPVVASRRGALAELEGRTLPGCLFDPDRPEELTRIVRALAGRREAIEAWRRALPPPASFADHAARIEAVYARLLGRAGTAGAGAGR